MCREITRRQTQKTMQILSTCYSQWAYYCNKKNHFYADICKTLVATDVPKNAIGNESLKYLFFFWKNNAAIREDVYDTCVYQQKDDIVDASVCLSAYRGYWWCFGRSVSTQMRLMMSVSINRWRIFMMLLSVYQHTDDTGVASIFLWAVDCRFLW